MLGQLNLKNVREEIDGHAFDVWYLVENWIHDSVQRHRNHWGCLHFILDVFHGHPWLINGCVCACVCVCVCVVVFLTHVFPPSGRDACKKQKVSRVPTKLISTPLWRLYYIFIKHGSSRKWHHAIQCWRFMKSTYTYIPHTCIPILHVSLFSESSYNTWLHEYISCQHSTHQTCLKTTLRICLINRHCYFSAICFL